MENANQITNAPPPEALVALPDVDSARRLISRWLLEEVGTALYPAEITFNKEVFAWHIGLWFSTPSQPMLAFIADVYINAATGEFLGRPTRDELLHRVEQVLKSEE